MIIETTGLGKIYDNGVKGLNDLTLEISNGEIFGLLGPNGAGKSTTVRLLNGTLMPTSGRSLVLGIPSGREKVRKVTSTVTESAQLYEYMSVEDNLLFFARLYDIETYQAKRRINELLKQLEIADRKDDKFGSFSTGMKKRVQLARALLHRPRILFLDEPTSGLDPDSARQVVGLIQRLSVQEGTTVVICTHNLPLAEQICTRYGFLVRGSLVWNGTREELLKTVMPKRIVQVTSERGSESFQITELNEINRIIRSLMDQGAHVTDVRMFEPTLEEAYFKIVKDNTIPVPQRICEKKQKGGEKNESIAS